VTVEPSTPTFNCMSSPGSTSKVAPLGTHLDELGNPCPHHARPAPESIYALATIGSRASGFNHDIASKLQGLMMALDEISELAETLDPMNRDSVARATEGAQACLKDVLAILNMNRAMTKPAMRAPVALSDLTARAGERVYVTLQGARPDLDVQVSAPTTIHALSLVLDATGGPGRGRKIPVEVSRTPTHVSISMNVAGPIPASADETLALAAFVLARDGGSLRCENNGQRFTIELPIAA
jgi:hypothetical protein